MPSFLGTGPFGRRVVSLLAEHFTAGEVVSVGDPVADLLVAALWRPAPALCERIDESAHAGGYPWLPVVMEGRAVRVGPWVSPGVGPCFRCYRDRRIQHETQWDSTHALWHAYDSDSTVGPAGFLPSHARLAAGATVDLITRGLAGDRDVVGRVITVGLHRNTLTSDVVVPCHGCDRCGEKRPDRDLRTMLRLSEAVGSDVR